MTRKIIGGTVYVSPSKEWRVTIYRHGFVEPVGLIPQPVGELIQEMSELAKERLGNKASPTELFEFMGWTPEPSTEEKQCPTS